MAGLIPEGATHLQATAFVRDDELSSIGGDVIIREEAKLMTEVALRKLLSDCVKVTNSDYAGDRGKTLRLDVYVIAPDELRNMLAQARAQGELDALKWGRR